MVYKDIELLSSEHFLLCRPQGGLNDILCQIQKTRLYADSFNRTLIVDTNFVNSEYFKDNFSNYFRTTDNVILNARPFISSLCHLTVFPTCVAGKLETYRAHYDPTIRNYVEKTTRQRTSFDFDIGYKEQLLVHHACGRGQHGVAALSWLRLNDVITGELIRRLSAVGGPYLGIHIRDTDYRTDYVRHLNLLRPRLLRLNCKNLFVATDNIECLEYCHKLFSPLNVFSFSSFAKNATPLHQITLTRTLWDRKINADAILDLVMLALSTHLFVMPLAPGSRHEFSGYSLLANELRSNRGVLDRLVPDVFAKIKFVNFLPTPSNLQEQTVDFSISRNSPCPCGSGNRYKHCCGRLVRH